MLKLAVICSQIRSSWKKILRNTRRAFQEILTWKLRKSCFWPQKLGVDLYTGLTITRVNTGRFQCSQQSIVTMCGIILIRDILLLVKLRPINTGDLWCDLKLTQTYLTVMPCSKWRKPVWNVKGSINLEFDYVRLSKPIQINPMIGVWFSAIEQLFNVWFQKISIPPMEGHRNSEG